MDESETALCSGGVQVRVRHSGADSGSETGRDSRREIETKVNVDEEVMIFRNG